MSTIELTSLTKYYGDVRGIESIDLCAEESDVIGFIGPNGAGKSTTIRTALGLLKATKGSATICGVSSNDPRRLFQNVGYLPAEVRVYPGLSVGRFLEITQGFYDRNCRSRTEELVDLLGIDRSRRFHDLSSGNRKKVGIAVAFLHSPKVVILDEPTDGLDPLVRAQFFTLLRQERERGTAILFSSHTLSEVQTHCSRFVFIRNGRLVEKGVIDEIAGGNVRRVTATATEFALRRIQRIAATTEGISLDTETVATDSVTTDDRHPITLLLRGEIGRLVAELPLTEMHDLCIEEPSLEELFLHYYRLETEE